MKRANKILLGVAGLGFLAVALSSCTTSFCSTKDKTRIAYTYDVYHKTVSEEDAEGKISKRTIDNVYVYGISTYWNNDNPDLPGDATNLEFTTLDFPSLPSKTYTFDNIKVTKNIKDNLFLNDINNSAKSSTYYLKVNDFTNFWYEMDCNFLALSINIWENSNNKDLYTNGVSKSVNELTINEIHNILVGTTYENQPLEGFGYYKYCGTDDKSNPTWEIWDVAYKGLLVKLGADNVPDLDFTNFIKNQYNGKMSSTTSCIATKGGFYGYYGYNAENKTEVFMEAKDWGYAWHLHNFPLLEGVFVFPISWLIDTISNGFMGAGNGLAQMLAILVVTFIIRGIMFLATFKSTSSNTKMQELQPEIAKIQAKYPNANTNKSERNAMAQETNALYKKNGVKPFSAILVLLVQFPVFICVWGAMQGSAILSSGSFLGLYLSESVSSVLFNINGWPNIAGWWTALVLFLIMAGLQILSMLLPQIIQKRKAKKAVASTGKNPNAKSQGNKMKWFTIIMVVMVIIMGFSLASGMVVYWIAGSIFSIAQTLITEVYIKNKGSKKKGPKLPKTKAEVKSSTGDSAVIDAEVTDVPDIYAAPTGKKKYKDKK